MAQYPTPDIAGPQYVKYTKHALDYKEITIFSKFEDGGIDTNTSASTAPQRWTLEYKGLTEAQAKTILDHYDAHQLTTKFTFKEPRNFPWTFTTGTTYTDLVQYEEPVAFDHDKVWVNSLTVKLIKRPS